MTDMNDIGIGTTDSLRDAPLPDNVKAMLRSWVPRYEHRAMTSGWNTLALLDEIAAMFDAIESGRQWETIARQAQEDADQLRTAAKEASRLIRKGSGYILLYEFNEAKRILDRAVFRDLTDPTPTPTDGA